MRQRFLKYSIVLLSLVVLGIMPSCNIDPDYTKEIQTIDSLTKVLKVASDEYRGTISSADTTWLDSIIVHIDHIQNNYRGIMKKEMAEVLRDYRNIPKAIPVISKNDLEIGYNIAFSENQLSELKQTLTTKATHDAAGNPIDLLYVQNAIGNESKSLENLAQKMKQNADLYVSVRERYLSLYPVVKNWVDSIPEKRPHK